MLDGGLSWIYESGNPTSGLHHVWTSYEFRWSKCIIICSLEEFYILKDIVTTGKNITNQPLKIL